MSESRRRVFTLVVLIAAQLLYVVSLLPWLMFAGLSAMAFDSPDAAQHWQPWAFVATIWSYPLWLIVFAVVGWILFAKRRFVGALIVSLVPLLPGIALLVWLGLVSVSTAP